MQIDLSKDEYSVVSVRRESPSAADKTLGDASLRLLRLVERQQAQRLRLRRIRTRMIGTESLPGVLG